MQWKKLSEYPMKYLKKHYIFILLLLVVCLFLIRLILGGKNRNLSTWKNVALSVIYNVKEKNLHSISEAEKFIKTNHSLTYGEGQSWGYRLNIFRQDDYWFILLHPKYNEIYTYSLSKRVLFWNFSKTKLHAFLYCSYNDEVYRIML